MINDSSTPFSRRWLCSLALLYALLMLYSSTVIGPGGMNFVPRDPAEAFTAFLATPYVAHGSDQRADWVGNLLMLVPFGFLLAGSLWPRRSIRPRPAAAGLSVLIAVLICVGVILAIKYLQLFFPPRTVTLNYILAQSIGAVIGSACWAVWRAWRGRQRAAYDPLAPFVFALWLYTGALILFILMPLDFALDAADLRSQLARLPETIWALPGSGRSLAVRPVLIFVAAAAFAPVGMALVLVRDGVYRVRRSLLTVAGRGVLLTAALYALATLVISAFPVLPSILYRTLGVIAGAAALRWLARQDAAKLLERLRRLVPLAAVLYLAVVLVMNRLVSLHWLSAQDAWRQVYPLGLWPLFDYYIVTKAEAAKNIVGHAVLYMPIGVIMWLRLGNRASTRAFALGALLSLVVEFARYFRPGLEGDINAVAVGAISAMLASKLMPAAWQMVQGLAAPPSAYRSDSAARRQNLR